MSEIKRYELEFEKDTECLCSLVPKKHGGLIKYTDYQSLIADKQKEIASKTLKAIERENKIVLLEEEIERLREALNECKKEFQSLANFWADDNDDGA